MTAICPRGHASEDPEYCDVCGRRIEAAAAATAPASAPVWVAVATADRQYFDAVAPPTAHFPFRYQPRRFALDGREILIGRRSASRGLAPEIDLSGAQEDMGISHRHAWLERQPDGHYALVDAGSTNGTVLNDEREPIAPHSRIPLNHGDRIHLGLWTTLTIERADLGAAKPPPRPMESRTLWLVSAVLVGAGRMRQQSPDRYESLVVRFQDLASGLAAEHGGTILGAVDEAAVITVSTPSAAAALALECAHRGTTLTDGPPGAAVLAVGIDVDVSDAWASQSVQASRRASLAMAQAANAGQVLVSGDAVEAGLAAALPADAALEDLGEHRLADLASAQRLHQVIHPSLPRQSAPLRVLDNRPNNLPEQLTDFIGRQREVVQVLDALRANRLCTITGPGGVGKTRLALQAAAMVLDRFRDGVWVADLSPVRDTAQVAAAVVDALEVREGGAGTFAPGRTGSRSAAERLVARLADADLLLVLDNCEHVIAAVADLATTLLRNCPTLRIVLTSREPVRLIGEAVQRLDPLTLPARSDSAESLRENDAVALFVNRALLQRGDLAVSDADLGVIADICARLDGIPLSIELAAAQTRRLGVGDIRATLDRLILAEPDPAPDGPHATLRTMIDWSHDLLTARERILFRRLAVFAGGWDVSACRVVCAGDGLERFEIADLLRGLTDKSLVETEPHPLGVRFRLLETTRQFAADRLEAGGESARLRAVHLAYYLDLAERAEPELSGRDCMPWFAAIDAERENLIAALATARTATTPDDLRLTAALAHFCLVRGQLTECGAWLDDALARHPDRRDPLVVKALLERAILACFSGDFERAEQAAERARALCPELDLPAANVRALTVLGLVAAGRNDIALAERLHARALAEAGEVSDGALLGLVLNNHANALALLGRTADARRQYDEGIRVRRERGDAWGLAWALFRSGVHATWEGRYPEAIDQLDEALQHARRIGFDQGVLLATLGAAEAFYVNGDQEAAGDKYAAALRLARELEEPTSACLALAGLALVAIARGDLTQAATWLTEEEAIEADRSAKTLAAVKASRAALASALGDDGAAVHLRRGALALRQELRDTPGMIEQLEMLAVIASRRGDLGEAATLLAAAIKRREETELPLPVIRRALVDYLLVRIAEHTTDELSAAFARGLREDIAVIVATAVADAAPATAPETAVPATSRGRLTIRADVWRSSVRSALVDRFGREDGDRLAEQYGTAFPPAYWMTRPADEAAADIATIEVSGDGIGVHLSAVAGEGPGFRRLKLVSRTPLALADVLPVLDHAGLRVLDEHPYRLRPADGREVWVYDLRLTCPDAATAAAAEESHRRFEEMFVAVWTGAVEDDRFNHLVLSAGLAARDVTVLRLYGRYLRLIGNAFSQEHIQRTLAAHPAIAASLVALFHARFDPDTRGGPVDPAPIVAAIDEVASLDEDRILRSLLQLVLATVRTNFFRTPQRSTLSVKLDPAQIPNLPLPRPMWEIFVYSPRLEGVHLRGGRVARGGLRWSDLADDFRTEVLGLMKAQMVKNTVIVPVGAKGGFIVRRTPGDTAARAAEGRACYAEFVRALLDVTDNIVDGVVMPPDRVVRHDPDDPYLVVAADKGTATFADLGNDISAEYGFWLGDAFAAGGSSGYDHKLLGITARGAWESAKRHFARLGTDLATAPVTVVGVGDMSGDVFGNGMLLSPHLKLVAAFDHRHIFVDPSPDPSVAFAERRRLARLDRSSWADYSAEALSPGGAVFSRHAKSVDLSPAARAVLGAPDGPLTPDDLVRAVLCAPVDLLYNGGIGTYVRATDENNADVGDKGNDAVRVTGVDLRCKVVVEGGNLGLTQRGRIEFALADGLINTDAIDNSAGVDCSDHEVNLKILLNPLVAEGALSLDARNELLAEMSDEVCRLVLRDNQLQALALARNATTAADYGHVHHRYVQSLERAGLINRSLAGLPTDQLFADRLAAGQGLTMPELAVVMAQTKMLVYDELLTSDLPDDPYLAGLLTAYFPSPVQHRFPAAIAAHPLRREIVATALANDLFNRQEVSILFRLQDETDATVAEVVRAYLVATALLDAHRVWTALDWCPDVINPLNEHVESVMRWLLQRRRGWSGDLAKQVDVLRGPFLELAAAVPEVLAAEEVRREAERLTSLGVPAESLPTLLVCAFAPAAMDIVELSMAQGVDPQHIAAVHRAAGEALHLHWLRTLTRELRRSTLMELLTRQSLADGLDGVHRAATDGMLASGDLEPAQAVAAWLAPREPALRSLEHLITEMKSGGAADAASIGLALGKLTELVRAA